MASYFLLASIAQLAILQVAFGQRFIPGCGPKILPAYPEPACSGPVLLNPGLIPTVPNVIPTLPTFAPGLPNYYPAVETILPNQLALPTTVVQDSSVANNLANALQLLVVSNLLSNTLPGPNEVVYPGYPYEYVAPAVPSIAPLPPCGCASPYGYFY